MGHEFWEIDSLKEAARNPPSECFSPAGQHRKTGPQRIARRRVCVARKGIEEQIGTPMACQMRRRRQTRCEDEARWVNAAVGRLAVEELFAKPTLEISKI